METPLQVHRLAATGLALLVAADPTLACTAVGLTAADGTVIAGRTMEWAFDMDWTLRSLPAGTALTLSAPPALDLPALEVTTRHALVGVSAEVIPGGAFLEGQNAAGLGMSANFLPGFTEYQSVTADDTAYVSIVEFGAWALGMNASVAEVRDALSQTKVWADPSLHTGATPPTLHMVFTDRSGDSVIVEYVGGELQMHDNVAGVLTNAPPYGWHLLNARNYLNLTTLGVAERQIGDANVTALGQGGGLTGLPGDYTPPSRFLRTAFLRQAVSPPATGPEAVQAVAHILNNVDIPVGVAQSHFGDGIVSDYTQWVTIKDLSNDRMLIADYDHRTTYLTLDLATIFAQTEPASVKVTDLPFPAGIDGTAALAP